MKRPEFSDYDWTGTWMVAVVLATKIDDYELDVPLPSEKEISDAIEGSSAGTNLGEYLGAAWEAAEEVVYDCFPKFREEEIDDD
jgi:hypothetical protein